MQEIDAFYHEDCRHFKGYIPCKPHKQFNVKCKDCSYYDKTDGIILIIKLGAIGDVIRTTPLLEKIKAEFPSKKIWWISNYPDILPDSGIDAKYNFDIESATILNATYFDLVINLDKDPQACALAKLMNTDRLIGFTLKNGMPAPAHIEAQAKFDTGLFDDVNKANKKSYLEEIFEICGWKFSGEEYKLDCPKDVNWTFENEGKKIIGLNTGCGDRWTSRLWDDKNWIELINRLTTEGFYPLLLGGKQEHEKNVYFQEQTGADYKGHFPLKTFISLVDQCDCVVSAVTMGMHLAMGLKKHLVLMNNIFNPYEFELYGRGEIVQPDKQCHCYFSGTCKNPDYKCMDFISVDAIFDAVKRCF